MDNEGAVKLNISIGEIALAEEDLLIEAKQKEGFYTVSDRGITVAIDTTLTPELIEEGFAREIVSKIQTMRKEADFNVTDNISVILKGSKTVTDVAINKSEDIGSDTLAVSITVGEPLGFVKDWDINGESVTIGIKKEGSVCGE